ncbi:retinol-binding protein pinta [Anthonomus grandis grandis]|uniref:retinol-binding protein pinta n=1 Tax=Anthonomus grandis grandis TaxID=2921223 RepID=UPI00216640AD|nr:retinol-binding protein pinta [Anthonomus grandis grandis]
MSTDETRYIFNLGEECRQYALENLNETEEHRNACLKEVKRWLEQEVPHIKARKEDRYLLPFLRGCKFNLTKTKVKIVNYYTMRKDCPQWFTDRNPLLPLLQELIKMGVFVPLRKPHNNQMVVIIRTAAHDPKHYKWDDLFKAGNMILDVASQEYEYSQVYGVTALFDMTGMSFGHYKSMTPALIKKIVFAWQNYHVRPKQLEFINSPIYINIALNIFKSFMTEKMRGRVKVHFGGVQKAQNVVSKDILPVEYGGNEDSLETLGNYWFEKLLEYKDWLAEDEKYKAQ